MNGIPEPLDHLPDAVKQVWRSFAAVEQITVRDIPVFEQFCDSYARWQGLIRKANESEPIVTIKGEPCTNPHLARADKEAANFRTALDALRKFKGRANHDDEDEEESPQALAELRQGLLDQLTAIGDDGAGVEEDRGTDGGQADAEIVSRPVRKKERTRTPATKRKKREE